MANRYFLTEVLVGITDAYMTFRGVDGIHLIRFNAFECSGYKVSWSDGDYPIDYMDYFIEREFQMLKRRHPAPTEHPFSHVELL